MKKDDLNEKLRENYILSSDILDLDIQEPDKEPRHPFKIRKTASALNRFTNQYAIEVHAGYDPKSFLTTVKKSIISLLSNNRQTKSQMILKCMFEETNLQTGETVTTESAFHSVTETILEATNIDELYKKINRSNFRVYWRIPEQRQRVGVQVDRILRNSHGKIQTHGRLIVHSTSRIFSPKTSANQSQE